MRNLKDILKNIGKVKQRKPFYLPTLKELENERIAKIQEDKNLHLNMNLFL